MKIIIAVSSLMIGIALGARGRKVWRQALAHGFTRLPPLTHPDCRNVFITWTNGKQDETPRWGFPEGEAP